jgi:hypothetical protein
MLVVSERKTYVHRRCPALHHLVMHSGENLNAAAAEREVHLVSYPVQGLCPHFGVGQSGLVGRVTYGQQALFVAIVLRLRRIWCSWL